MESVASPFRRGVDDLNARRFRRARRVLAEVARAGGPDSEWACQELVQTFLRPRDWGRAEAFLDDLLESRPELLAHSRGYLLRRIGRLAEAEDCFVRALGARPKPWAAQAELGWMRWAAGRESEGLGLLKRAEARFSRQGDEWGLATVLTHRGTAAMNAFHLREAVRLLERARDLKSKCGDRLGHSTCSYHLGLIHLHAGRYSETRQALEDALAEQRSIGFDRGAAASLNALAVCQIELGNGERALDLLRQALRLQRRGAGGWTAASQAMARTNLGIAHALCRRPAQAIAAHRRALALVEDQPNGEPFSLALVNLAELLVERGRPHEALRRLHDPVITSDEKRIGLRARIALERSRATALLAAGKADGAIDAARRSLALARRVPSAQRDFLVQHVESEAVLGRALLAAGKKSEARTRLRSALRRAEALRRLQPSAALRMGVGLAIRRVSEALVSCLTTNGARGVRAAWRVVQELKARELGAWRRSSGESDRMGEIDEVAAEIGHLAVAPSLSRRDLSRLRDLRRRYLDLIDAEEQSAPGAERPATAAEVSAALGDEAALIEYHVAADVTHVFVVHGAQVRRLEVSIREAELARRVELLIEPLRLASTEFDAGPRLGAWDVTLSHALHEALLAPALRTLPASVRRLVLVRDGPLHLLPFGLLVSRPPESSGADPFEWFGAARYVQDDYTLSHAPSASLARGSGSWSSCRLDRALALGWSPPESGVTVQRADGPRHVTALPGVEAEARAVGGLFPESRVLTGSDATARGLLAGVRHADVVHVTAHGISDARAPGLSGIVLGPSEAGSEADFLTAEALSRRPLSASLVTLAACETGVGRLHGGEGVLGLARSCVEAGADAVIASAWPVDDRAARELMSVFYRELTSGVDAPRALTRAGRALRRAPPSHPEWAHPFYWASFTLLERRRRET